MAQRQGEWQLQIGGVIILVGMQPVVAGIGREIMAITMKINHSYSCEENFWNH